MADHLDDSCAWGYFLSQFSMQTNLPVQTGRRKCRAPHLVEVGKHRREQ